MKKKNLVESRTLLYTNKRFLTTILNKNLENEIVKMINICIMWCKCIGNEVNY